MCIRCRERQAFGDRGYCITCVWAVQVEIEQGMNRLQEYLNKMDKGFAKAATQGNQP